MRRIGAKTWGVNGLVLAAGVALGLATTAGCSGDDDEAPAVAGRGGTTAGGQVATGATAGKAAAQGGAGAGGEESCVCGSKLDHGTIPLECACDAGLCTTFEDDLARYQSAPQLGLPYYVLLGTCDDGYRTLRHEEATEQGRQRTYDAEGRMVYDRFDGISPSSCVTTIGTDPAKNCAYCLVTANDDETSGGAAGASGAPFYPESLTAPCDAALLE